MVAAAALETNDLDLCHFVDAEQAFVQSKLDTDVSMRMPDACRELSGKVVLLNRSFYGLKQSARSWLDLLISTFQANGFEQSMSEPCLLRLKDPESNKIRLILAAHVDDMIVAGTAERKIATGCVLCCLKCFQSMTWASLHGIRNARLSGMWKRVLYLCTYAVQSGLIDKIVDERFHIFSMSPSPAAAAAAAANCRLE